MPGMKNKLYTDVLIIGGGVIGCSICWQLSKKGISTLLVEKSGIATGSSGACDGFIFLQSKKDKDIARLTFRSMGIFENLAEELSYDIEFEKCGGLVINNNVSGINSSISNNTGISAKGRNIVGFKKLSSVELRRIEPMISENIRSATLCESEGQVNPINLNFGFAQASKKNGAKVLTGEEVIKIDVELSGERLEPVGKDIIGKNRKSCKKPDSSGRETDRVKKIRKVYTDSGKEIIAKEVVCACGAWSEGLGKLLGCRIPVIPRKGILIVTEALPKVINCVILDYDYMCSKFDDNDNDFGFTIEQTKSGNLLIGSTREFVGFNDRIDFGKVSQLICKAKKFFPFLSDVNIIRIFPGFRPYSASKLPIMGKACEFENFWVAAGHEGDGIALSPVTGLLMGSIIAEKIKSGKILGDFTGINIGKFSPQPQNIL